MTVVVSLVISAGPGQARARENRDTGKDLFTITVDTKGFQPYRMAFGEPIANDRPLGQFVHKVAKNNLRIATSFRVLKQRTYPQGWRAKGLTPDISRWRAIGAQGLMLADVVVTGKSAKFTFVLWDFTANVKTEVLRRVYTARRKSARRVVHGWCNEVMEYYTKVKGAFGTQLAFVATKSAKRKYVYVSDHDGYGLRRVSKAKSLNILPSWSPDGRYILFTSYVRRNPDLYRVLSVGGVVPRRVSRRTGLNSGAVYSPDGKTVALTLTKDGNSEIYLLSAQRKTRQGFRIIKRLTNHSGIDTSPTWSPDGKRIAFVSNRYGHPQLWIMNADGSRKRRLTRRGYYNTTPTWCQRKGSNRIAFTSRKNGRFAIFTYNIATRRYRRITWTTHGNNEEPTWAPNCQLIAYASSRGGIWVSNASGSAQTRIYKGKALQPRWGPWATLH